MGRGGYNGGSTLIGLGRSWSFDPDFAGDSSTLNGKGNGKGTHKGNAVNARPFFPTNTAGGKRVAAKTLRKHRAVLMQKINRDEVLAAIGESLPTKHPQRGAAMKRLVANKVLLQTGAINIGHPAVAAWLKSNGKKTKKNG